MSEIQVPKWLRDIAEGQAGGWPNGEYPHVAFRSREIVAAYLDGDDAQVCLLQDVIDKVDRLRASVDDLRKGLEAICRGLNYELTEQDAGRLTSFQMVMAYARRLLEASEAARKETRS